MVFSDYSLLIKIFFADIFLMAFVAVTIVFAHIFPVLVSSLASFARLLFTLLNLNIVTDVISYYFSDFLCRNAASHV